MAPGSVNDVAHSTVMSSAPFAVITGGAFETWIVADDALLGAGFGSAVADVTFADAAIAEPLAAAQSASATVSVNVGGGARRQRRVRALHRPAAARRPAWLQDQPAGTVSDWNTVCAGTAVVSDTLAAGRSSSVGLNDAVSASALFVTVIV